jgi:putative membrane protein
VHSPGDPNLGGGVDPIIIFGNLGYALAGMILMFAGFLVFDKLTPRVNFADEIGKGNMAVAMIISALFVSLAFIIGRSLN